MRKPITLVLTILYAVTFAQITPIFSKMKEKRSDGKITDLFSLQSNRNNPWPEAVQDYTTLRLNTDQLKRILSSDNKQLEIIIPSVGRSNIALQLNEVTQEPFSVKSGATGKTLKYQIGKHYRGFIKGNEHSVVAISFFKDEIMGFISDGREKGNLVLGKIGNSREDYVLYKDDTLFGKSSLNCETAISDITYDAHMLNEDNQGRALSDCVRFYYEIDDDIVADKGGATPAINYITGLHNQVAALYAAENINVIIAEIVVWETTSPYNSTTSSGMLNQFTAYRNGFNGNFAMLLSYKATGGIAYVNTLCNSDPDFRMGFSSIFNTYSTLPNYSWSVNVITHEFGHLFGSQHTHDCVWNGNNTAIDGCATPIGCANPGLPPVGSGTIMSYCHTTSVGINFANGFGPQPGNVIRNSVTNASCLIPCNGPAPTCTDGIQNGAETGVDCGGPTCPPCSTACNQNSGMLTIVFDDYPSETSWAITNSAGDILLSGTNYTNPGETINVPVCLTNGCYSFTIFDSFGDGICCLYGNGSYTLIMNGVTVATGGQFANQAISPFCVNGAPTCNDGVQNGDETGVDCGGSCPACPTCTDGVQNGDETGVDCGGSCAACPTCTDGIQNGDETGIDCGGSCTACPTCNDGIQNGDETGIDCGGSCAACPTCTDGIQNGNETGIDCGGSCAACPTCNDGVQNGDETGIDCGGSCAACPTCNDGVQNGDETGIDCGGSCGNPSISIAESTSMCIDFFNYLTPNTGGTWSSSDTLVATVNNAGEVYTIGAGNVYFTFTTSGGCVLPPTTIFTVNETPIVGIAGSDSICIGGTTQLIPASGGTWTFGASGEGVVTVSNEGVVSGIGLGATTFKYTSASTGCTSMKTSPVSVVDVPSASLTGNTILCIGQQTNVTASGNGTWSSSDESIATVDYTGNVTAVGSGNAYFIFTDAATGCTANTGSISVNASPTVQLNVSSLCVGSTVIAATNEAGIWSNDNPNVLTINNTGNITALSQGTAQIQFVSNSTGCTSDLIGMTVNANPEIALVGNATICIGSTTTLSPSVGGVWFSNDPSIAAVNNNGIVSGISAGDAYFTFTNSATGCTSTSGLLVSVQASNNVNILGNNNVCVGGNTALSPSSGGTWVSSNNSVATVNNNGMVSAVGAGIVAFTFTNSATGCTSTTDNLIVNGNPIAIVSGSSTICTGTTTTLSPATGGIWSSSNPSIASIDNNGIVTGVSAGIATFTFTSTSTSCVSNPSSPVTVSDTPIASIAGGYTICVGATSTLTPSSGGTWSSSNPSVASVTNTGIVTGLNSGNVTFTFISNTNSCVSLPTNILVVNDNPTISSSNGNNLCQGNNTAMSPSSGGTWSSSDNSIVSIDNNGIATAINSGSAQLTYTNLTTGCSSSPMTINVAAKPIASINGTNTLCIQGTTTLNPSTGGTWTSSNAAVATVNNNGLVTGISAGNATFVYTSSTTGCSSTPTSPITINSNPIVGFNGSTTICVGTSTALSPSTGGSWTSSNISAASVNNSGIVTGISAGNANFTFTSTATGCSATTTPLTVNALPLASITGSSALCVGNTTTLAPATGGTWTSTNTSVATVSSNGVATAIGAGLATFIYTDAATGCVSNPSGTLTVNDKPLATIVGSNSICIGATTTLNPASGGTWSSSNPSIASVSNNGIATGITAGTVSFTFTAANGCTSNPTALLTVNAKPTVAITGATSICVGTTSSLSPSTGGTWASNNNAVATVTNAGIVTGVSSGSTSFIFTSDQGCVSNATPSITIKALPVVSITGSSSICVGATTTISPTTGGTWVSSNTAQATVTNAGVVTGVSAGTPNFTFTNTTTGCSATTPSITVNAKPTVAITGATSICVGSTTTLSPSIGGTWVSSNTARATVTNTGIVTGVSAGTVTFTFTSTAGCVSSPTPTVTVKAKPTASITGSTSICVGSTTTLSPTTGGTWSSSNTAIATVTNAGVVTGVSAGSVTFVFTNSTTGCPSNPTAAITIKERPIVAITGGNPICVGSTTTLSPSSGGTWTSSATTKATVTNAGIVTGVGAGTATFTFTNTATGCASLPTPTVTVNALPVVAVTGSTTICVGGSTTLTPATGGTWTSTNPAVATISNSGVVTAIATGTSTFIFTNSTTGCSSSPSAIVTVSACNNVGGYYFETGWDNWVDGGIDAERYTGTNSAEGVWSIALRDNSAVESSMTSATLSLGTYQSIKVEFKFKLVGVESGEDFWLQYSSDGTTFTTVKAYARGSVYTNGVVYSDIVTLNAPTWTLTNNAKLRFVADASDDTDLFYIDAVVVNGFATPQANSDIAEQRTEDAFTISTNNFGIFPNPINTEINIKMDGSVQDQENYYEIAVYDVNGKIVSKGQYQFLDIVKLDASNINNGLYILQIALDKTILLNEKIIINH